LVGDPARAGRDLVVQGLSGLVGVGRDPAQRTTRARRQLGDVLDERAPGARTARGGVDEEVVEVPVAAAREGVGMRAVVRDAHDLPVMLGHERVDARARLDHERPDALEQFVGELGLVEDAVGAEQLAPARGVTLGERTDGRGHGHPSGSSASTTSLTATSSASVRSRRAMRPTARRSSAASARTAGPARTAEVTGVFCEALASVLARRMPMSAVLVAASSPRGSLAGSSSTLGQAAVCTEPSWVQLQTPSVANGMAGASSRSMTSIARR